MTATDIIQIDAGWMNSLIALVPFFFSNMSVVETVLEKEIPQTLRYLIAATMAAVPCSFGVCESHGWMNVAVSSDTSGDYDYSGVNYKYPLQLSPEEVAKPRKQRHNPRRALRQFHRLPLQ